MPANLLNPVWVTVQQWDSTKQVMDTAAREPLHGARGGPQVKLQCQVKWNKRSAPQYNAAGVVPKSEGYIIVRRSDMRAKSVQLKRGDKILSFGVGPNATTGLALYLTEEVPLGHHSVSGGSELAKFAFEDRNPGSTP